MSGKADKASYKERLKQALALRRAGVPFQAIADTPGPDGDPLFRSRQAAHQAVSKYLREVAQENREQAEQYTQLELERLDHMASRIWNDLSQNVDREDRLRAVDRLLKISEARRRLLGLDAPQRTALTDPEGGALPQGGGGGAILARPPEDIRLGDIIRSLEAGHPLVECLGADGGNCTLDGQCRLKGRLRVAEAAFLAELNQSTLADIAVSHPARRSVTGPDAR